MTTLVGTNLELFGSELEQKIKEASAKTEPVWLNLDTNTQGLYIWRVRNFKLEPIKFENYGVFYEGDSYVILNIQKTSSNNLSYNIHFWLGNNTTPDEMGTAAYKTVELDTFLHGIAVQNREVQGSESSLFRSYFIQGITYKLGGIESGFKKVLAYDYSKYVPLLYRIKNTSVTHVPLTLASINEDDVFVLDNGPAINTYSGKNSSHVERLLCEYTTTTIKDSRKNCIVSESSSIDVFKSCFNSLANFQENISQKLYRITEADNKTSVTEVDGQINKKSFDSNDAFLFCTYHTTFIWIGKNSSYNELLHAWKTSFSITEPTTAISLIKEGSEPETFMMSL